MTRQNQNLAIDLIRLEEKHWPKVSQIHKDGIKTGNATFETHVSSWEDWDKAHLRACRFVALSENNVAGWAVLSPVSGRCIYSGVAEVSVYVSASYQRQGIGSLLLDRLVQSSETEGIWTLQAGIFPENEASIRLHQKLGFRTVGIREKIGKMGQVWRDVVLMERRSSKTGL
jgi:L-amino acid N-acyltransferase YncA